MDDRVQQRSSLQVTMSSGAAGSLVPTLHGFVHNTIDALRASLIKRGSIFVYKENTSGIKRWTDGLAWSPSRILGNFLIYRELEKPFPPGAKKRAIERRRTTAPGGLYLRRDSDESNGADLITHLRPPPSNPAAREVKLSATYQEKDLERSLIGSSVDSYGFQPDGLVKKTMSVSVNGISHHMVSYCKVEDVKNNLLPRPLSDPCLQNISVCPELYLKQNFRAPVEETEHYVTNCHMHAHPQAMYLSMLGGHGIQSGQYVGRPYTSMYDLQASTGASIYGAITGTSWPMQQASVSPYGNRGYSSQSYTPNHYQPLASVSPYGNRGYSSKSYTPNHYQPLASPSAPAVKTESQHTGAPPSLHNAQCPSNYTNMPRQDPQSNSIMPPAYHSAAQPPAPSFGQ
ncbi:Global transcription regulator sge1 [Elasticomyces elasticus]|nr:Global transcription regulator sge1 [Elasticomyces elasticus]